MISETRWEGVSQCSDEGPNLALGPLPSDWFELPVVKKARDELDAHFASLQGEHRLRSVEFGQLTPRTKHSRFNPSLDDAVVVTHRQGDLKIFGTNPRSILIGAYRALHRFGFRWIRPGPTGLVWRGDASALTQAFEFTEIASHRHRGVCIEGAVSLSHVVDLINWLPTLGLNSYFIQFREPREFMRRWYDHLENPNLQRVELSDADFGAMTKGIEKAVEENGLLLHAVGHGWTCAALGITANGWDKQEVELPPGPQGLVAEIGGERALFKGVAMNTNLCYGQPIVRQLIVNEVVAYANAHPNVAYLHFWLADEINNQCECSLCRDTLPADFYVQMLNEIDRLLQDSGCQTKIVFLCYLDLLWAPKKERLRNPERFVIMFAPITRRFDESLTGADSATAEKRALPPYIRNAVQAPKTTAENLAFLNAWTEANPSLDSFVFDYHFMWAHYQDFGRVEISKTLAQDIDAYTGLNLNGLLSCQVQRSVFPSAFPMRLLGRLWQRSDFSHSLDALLEDEYGSQWLCAFEILSALTRLCNPADLRKERSSPSAELLSGWRTLISRVPGWLATCSLQEGRCSGAQALSWRMLAEWLTLLPALCRALIWKECGEVLIAKQWFREFEDAGRRAECAFASHFDWHQCVTTLRNSHFQESR